MEQESLIKGWDRFFWFHQWNKTLKNFKRLHHFCPSKNLPSPFRLNYVLNISWRRLYLAQSQKSDKLQYVVLTLWSYHLKAAQACLEIRGSLKVLGKLPPNPYPSYSHSSSSCPSHPVPSHPCTSTKNSTWSRIRSWLRLQYI